MLKVLWRARSDSEGIYALSVSSDGSVVIGLARGVILHFPASDAASTPVERRGHEGGTLALQHSTTGRLLISGGGDGCIRLWPLSMFDPDCSTSPLVVRLDAPGAVCIRKSTLVESVSTDGRLPHTPFPP